MIIMITIIKLIMPIIKVTIMIIIIILIMKIKIIIIVIIMIIIMIIIITIIKIIIIIIRISVMIVISIILKRCCAARRLCAQFTDWLWPLLLFQHLFSRLFIVCLGTKSRPGTDTIHRDHTNIRTMHF